MNHLDTRTHAEEAIERAWLLIGAAQVREARALSERLVQDLLDLLEEQPEHEALLLPALLPACHVAGYAVGMSVRGAQTLLAVSYFEEMLRIARKLEDASAAAIALTYQGDMHRRSARFAEALRCLQTAYALPHSEQAVRGNCAQLLGRLYSQRDEEAAFGHMMQEAEQIARVIEPSRSSLHGQYCLGTVYIDYSKHYTRKGDTRTALDYFARAQALLPDMPHWRTLLTATHGLLLVRSGEIEQGMPYVLTAVKMATAHGNYRLLDHFSTLQRDLARQALALQRAQTRLRESLCEASDD
jgi:tetratricopeptide (TPR) repeat protein